MKYSSIIILLILSFQLKSQNYDKRYFRSPVNFPLRLAGNFGEIRPNHFHSGIDIKASTKGLKVFAAADGYVSRIRKSAGGYGNALYITHPNGLKTVYGHMQKFNKELEEYSENIQYSLNNFEFVKYPDSTRFKIKKGDIIGYIGNSGRSYGPHLHFEIRETEKDVPINPCYFNFKIVDNIKPKIYSIGAYALDENGNIGNSGKKQFFKVYKKGGNYFINKVIYYTGKLGISVRANDFLNATKNTQGIYSLKMFFDGKQIYSHKTDKISFEESRYINSFIDFEERQISGDKYQKCFIEPGNKLSFYGSCVNSGIVENFDSEIHKVKIELADIYGNKTYLFLKISGKKAEGEKRNLDLFYYDKDNFFERENFRAYFTKGTIYKNIEKEYEIIKGKEELYSDIHKLCSYKIPVHEKIHIAIRTNILPKHLINKALLVVIDKNGKFSSIGGSYINDFFVAKTNRFGKFAISVDEIPPEIIEENFPEGNNFSEKRKISFKIKDNLSGIKEYSAKIDKKNIIFTYDKKNNRISYVFDRHIDNNNKHNLEIIISDKKNNKTVYKTIFFK